MKKLLSILSVLFAFTVSPVLAKTAPVEILQDFSVNNPSDTLLIKVLSNVKLNKDVMLFEGFYVLGQINKVANSSFVFIPVKYQNFHNEVYDISGNYPAKIEKVLEGNAQNGCHPRHVRRVPHAGRHRDALPPAPAGRRGTGRKSLHHPPRRPHLPCRGRGGRLQLRRPPRGG